MATPLQGYGRYDVLLASCSATVPVLYRPPTWKKNTVTPTASHVPQPRHVDSAPVLTAHRSSYFTTTQTNHLTLSGPVALKMPIWCRSSRGKIGSLNSMMTCHNRPQFLIPYFDPSTGGPCMHHTTFVDCC